MKPRSARRIAWALVGIFFLLTTAGLALQALTNTSFNRVGVPLLIVMNLLAGVWMIIGALIVSRHPRHPVGWLLSFGVVGASFDMFASGYVAYDAAYSGSLPGVALALVWLKWSTFPFTTAAFTLILLLFPDGHLPSPRWRKVAWTAVAALFVYLPLKALEPGPVDPASAIFQSNPLGVSAALWAILEPLAWAAFSVLALCYAAALFSLLVRLRRARGDERQQIKWLVYSAALYWISVPLLVIGLFEPKWELLMWMGMALGVPAVAGMLIATALAILKYRLYDIDVIVNRTLVYGTLTASTMGLYVFIVGSLGNLLQPENRPLIAFFTTGLVAVLFQPLRQRLQRGVNRLMYGERDDPLGALSKLGRRLEAAVAPEVVLPTLVETIAQTLKLPYVAISLRSGDGFKIAAVSGDEVADPIGIPLVYQGATVGQLIAGPRGPGESLSQADRQLLENVAHQAGPAAYAVQLTRDLRQSRVRLVTAREEERRRLRRDLHDGLGPVLASQGLKMAAVSQLLPDAPPPVRRLLEELAAQNEATVAEIRRLVYELRPAALDDLGLVGAVCDYASGLRGGYQDAPRLQVDVQPQAGGLPSLPAACPLCRRPSKWRLTASRRRP